MLRTFVGAGLRGKGATPGAPEERCRFVEMTSLARFGARFVGAAVAVSLTVGTAACKPDAGGKPAVSRGGTPAPTATATGKAPTRPTGSVPVQGSVTATAPAAATSAAAPEVPTGLTSATFAEVVPAKPGLVAVKDMGPIRQNARVGGRDGGQSTRYGNKSVWIFADTTLQNPWGFLSNSVAGTTDLKASDGIDLRSSNGFTIDNSHPPLETVPRTAAEKAFEKAHAAPPGGCKGIGDTFCGASFGFWPGPIFADPVRHRVLFTYGKLCRGGQPGTTCSGPLGKGLGMGIGAIDMRTGTVTRLTTSTGATSTSVEGNDPTIFFPPGTTGAGSGAGLVVDDTAYLYGQCDYFDCAVARVALGSIADRSAWRWYNGSTWVADSKAAKKVGAQPGAAGNTVFHSAALRGYVDVYMPYGHNEVWYRVGASPFGPWSGGVKLMTTAGDPARPNYSLYGHPEFAEKNGAVQYLSYFNGRTGAQHLIRWEMRIG